MANKKGFNEYKVFGDITEIYISDKENNLFTAIIDTDKLNELISLNHRWHCLKKEYGIIYVATTIYFEEEGKKKHRTFCLHDILLNLSPKGFKIHVDHIDHDPFNNRVVNFRIISRSNNNRNRKSKNSNNTTGQRNVCYYEGWYLVQLQINGKNKLMGKFKNLEEAAKFAEEMRQKYYGEFSGKN